MKLFAINSDMIYEYQKPSQLVNMRELLKSLDKGIHLTPHGTTKLTNEQLSFCLYILYKYCYCNITFIGG